MKMKCLLIELEGKWSELQDTLVSIINEFTGPINIAEWENGKRPEPITADEEEIPQLHIAAPIAPKPVPPQTKPSPTNNDVLVENPRVTPSEPRPFRAHAPTTQSVPQQKKIYTWETDTWDSTTKGMAMKGTAIKGIATKMLNECRICGRTIQSGSAYRAQVSNPVARVHEDCVPIPSAPKPAVVEPPPATPVQKTPGEVTLYAWEKAPKRLAMMDFPECRLCDEIIKKGQQYRCPTSNTSARAHEDCVQRQADLLTRLAETASAVMIPPENEQ